MTRGEEHSACGVCAWYDKQVAHFDQEHEALLRQIAPDTFTILHQVWLHAYTPIEMLSGQQFPETFKSKHSSGIPTCLFVNRHAKMGLSEHKCSSVGRRWPWASWFPKCANIYVPMRCCVRCTTSFVTSRITEKAILKSR